MGHELRGRTRRLLQQQLPPGAPPDFVPPGRPQPLPEAQRIAQVWSAYGALPVGGRMFAESQTVPGVAFGEGDPPARSWLFDLATPAGCVRVLRAVRLLPKVTDVGGGRSHFRVAAPGRMAMQVRLNQLPVPQVADDGGSPLASLANHGELWPVYLVAGEQDTVGLFVVDGNTPGWGSSTLTAVFYGDLLRARGLPKELEVGHPAPFVRVLQEDY